MGLIVGVLSDTHDSMVNLEKAIKVFKSWGVSAVIHLGDFVAPFTLRLLLDSLSVKFEGVFGNNDGERLGLVKIASLYNGVLGEQPRIVSLGGRRILLAHGFGDPASTYEVVRGLVESGRWDAVFYGHTHEANIEYVRGKLLLNPGDGGGALNKPTIAIVDLTSLRARLVDL